MSELEPLAEGEEERLSDTRQLASGDSIGRPQHGRSIDTTLLVKAVEKQGPRSSGMTDITKMLAKQTHLHLNGMRIGAISTLRSMQKLEVLYLYDNMIHSMGNGLSQLKNLTHLYLQNNYISEIEGLSGLQNLSKLYLQGNLISHVSNLQNLPSLEELHLSNQRMPPGHGLTFDMHAMLAVSGTLRVLCARSCCIKDESVAMLPPLPVLRKLDLSDNYLEVVECLETVMRSASRLLLLELHDNPFCKGQHQRYRDSVILMSDSVASLDGEEITAQQRSFLLRFQIQKLKTHVQESCERPSDSMEPPLERQLGSRQAAVLQQHSVSHGTSSFRTRSLERSQAPGAATKGGEDSAGRGSSKGLSLPSLEGTRIR